MFRLLVFYLLFFSLFSCSQSLQKVKSIERAGYAIQVGAFSDVRNAEALTSKLQEKGIEAFYFKKEDGLFAVRFGSFHEKNSAEEVAKKMVKRGVISDYYIAPPMLYKRLPLKKEQKKHPDDMGFIIAKTAERFVGIPYKWGGNNVAEGMDCSGFVKAVYNLCGINLPRTAREQYLQGETIEKDELVEGDLVFFGISSNITHVGIYIGKGNIVHAPKRGDVIKRSSLDSDYFTKKYVGARRYF